MSVSSPPDGKGIAKEKLGIRYVNSSKNIHKGSTFKADVSACTAGGRGANVPKSPKSPRTKRKWLVKEQRRCRAHIRWEPTWVMGECETTGAGVCPVAAGREGNHQLENDCIMKASFQCAGNAISCEILSFIKIVGNCPLYVVDRVRRSTSMGLTMPASLNICCRKDASLS